MTRIKIARLAGARVVGCGEAVQFDCLGIADVPADEADFWSAWPDCEVFQESNAEAVAQQATGGQVSKRRK